MSRPENHRATAPLFVVALAACGMQTAEDRAGAAAALARGKSLLAEHSALPRQATVEGAIEALEEAARLTPHDAQVRYWAGRARERWDGDEEALVHYRAAVAADPELADAHRRVARLLHEGGEIEQALAAYDRARSLGLEDPEWCLGMGKVLEDLDRLAEARPLYERAIALREAFDQAHFRLAHVLRLAGDAEGAEREMEAFYRWNAVERDLALAREAARKTSGDPAAHLQVARLSFQLQRDDAALASMRRAVDAAPQDAGLRLELGALHLELDQHAEALVAFDAAIARDGGNVEARLGRAQALVALGRPSEAAAEYRAVLAIDPEEARARDSLEALEGGGGR